MRLLYALVFILTLGFINATQAHLGETEAELKARYGEPKRSNQLDPEITEFTFNSDGWIIKAQIYEGKCQYISYLKTPLTESFNEAREKLLSANAQGSSWSLKDEPHSIFVTPKKLYYREDGQAIADIPKHNYLNADFYTVKWQAYNKTKETAKRKTATSSGF